VHYAGHMHDPYDDLDLAQEQADALAEMATVALTGALTAGFEQPELRLTPPPTRRAVFVASHTEPPQMTPAGSTELGMALAWEGFDVDTVPYGHPVTAADLLGASLVVALPALDYTIPELGNEITSEAWGLDELAALQDYVTNGGLLVLPASAHRLKFSNAVLEDNEDWAEAGTLGSRFGVTFSGSPLAGSSAAPSGTHPLLAGVTTLELAAGNALPVVAPTGLVLASSGGRPVMTLVSLAGGEVLALGDLGILGTAQAEALNLTFWRNLARWAAGRS